MNSEYIISLTQGTVTRVSDGKIIAPCQSASDPDFVAYIEWVHAGNTPTEVE